MFFVFLDRTEAKTKICSFLTKSCGPAPEPPIRFVASPLTDTQTYIRFHREVAFPIELGLKLLLLKDCVHQASTPFKTLSKGETCLLFLISYLFIDSVFYLQFYQLFLFFILCIYFFLSTGCSGINIARSVHM